MKHHKEIKYKKWNITIDVLQNGFDINATSKDQVPMSTVHPGFGHLKTGIEGMKKIIDNYEVQIEKGLKELEGLDK